MLYIIKRLKDSYYLNSLEDTKKLIEFTFTPLKSDALMLPENIAERSLNMINEIENDKYKIIPVKWNKK